jgi:S1-C subfamily serine protease
MLFNNTKLVVLGGLLISCLFVTGQTFKGCGAFINVDGDIITSAHVIGDKTRSIIVEDFVGKRYPATIKKIDRTIDLAVISVNQKTRNFAFLRMDDNNDFALTPVLEEAVNFIGYPHQSILIKIKLI